VFSHTLCGLFCISTEAEQGESRKKLYWRSPGFCDKPTREAYKKRVSILIAAYTLLKTEI
jgi:hypothetical protein